MKKVNVLFAGQFSNFCQVNIRPPIPYKHGLDCFTSNICGDFWRVISLSRNNLTVIALLADINVSSENRHEQLAIHQLFYVYIQLLRKDLQIRYLCSS